MMQARTRARQQGIAHLGLMLALVIVFCAIGFAGYRVFTGKHPSAGAVVDTSSRVAAEKSCTQADKNICKFMANWKVQQYYTVQAKGSPADKASYEAIYKVEGEDKFHLVSAGETPFEMIVIGKDTYTKAGNGVWWKQSTKPEVASSYSERFNFGKKDSTTVTGAAKDTMTYKRLGKEACGSLVCFKYQVIDSTNADTKEYIWFDDHDYQLRHTRSESRGGFDDSTFSYDKVTIAVPSPVKELGPDQYLVPGQSEPLTMPDAGSYQDYLNSLPQGASATGADAP